MFIWYLKRMEDLTQKDLDILLKTGLDYGLICDEKQGIFG